MCSIYENETILDVINVVAFENTEVEVDIEEER